ncbi:hypothetical protein NEOLEDRAFT_749710 [Neolentinus lepideus HHB14362 ss-1]|uniref:Secreted protein n=1 Tax=Neolentinus lepideus HHB14362 ss-1 TaxID=1314782 RepID=A0A165PTS7_9AGAM|nr:hypothetical protein NEOLEDRAFT_749710 [Neolentinus lepideus HHB14362 ss-1]
MRSSPVMSLIHIIAPPLPVVHATGWCIPQIRIFHGCSLSFHRRVHGFGRRHIGVSVAEREVLKMICIHSKVGPSRWFEDGASGWHRHDVI